ncbi:solute carrier family 35 member F1-like isoform X2 [Punica granatum]|uniref:Solute carrier family 35 member F1-like isoform X2 n=1 Tax=Punica granatum TaxID=22663 RepID=A0A6P8CLG3_PUNGR|nr:solute carrier family 35 member F1-like isoform X2 [Punica granatum]
MGSSTCKYRRCVHIVIACKRLFSCSLSLSRSPGENGSCDFTLHLLLLLLLHRLLLLHILCFLFFLFLFFFSSDVSAGGEQLVEDPPEMEDTVRSVSWSGRLLRLGHGELHLLPAGRPRRRCASHSDVLPLRAPGSCLWQHIALQTTQTVGSLVLVSPLGVHRCSSQLSRAVNEAYQFSSITSVTLLDCWTIAWVIILTWFLLGTHYSIWQLIGAAISVLGLGLVMLSDAGAAGGGGSRPVLGDVLVIAGTVFIAMSNVGQEFCVKKKDLVEVLTMLPLFGVIVSVVQISILERTTLESLQLTTDRILAFAGFAVSIFVFYSVTEFVLRMSGAALFNLSLLTSDMWAVVIRIFFYRQEVDWLYYLAFSIVIIGLVVYSVTGKDPGTVPSIENGISTDYHLLNDESIAPRAEDSEL